MGASRPQRTAQRASGPPPEEGQNTDAAGLAGALAARARRPSAAEIRRRRTILAAGTAVAVAAVVVAVLLLGGARLLVPASKGPTTPANAPSSYYGDLGPALATARASYWSWPGGGPALVFAMGLASATQLGPPVNLSHLGAVACAPTLIISPFGSLPSDANMATAGVAPVWLYAFQATGNTLVVVAVLNGTAAIVATTPTNGACYDGPGSFTQVPVDSSVAAATAAATAQSKRFFANATANSTSVSAEYFLVPPNYLKTTPAGTEPIWILTDTSCSLYGQATSAGHELTTVLDASTGTLTNQTTTPVTC